MAHYQNVTRLSVFTGITLVDVVQNWLSWFHLLFLEGGLLIFLIDCMIFQSPFVVVTRMSVNSFFPHTVRLWNSPAIECFHLIYDCSGFKYRINRHLLTVVFF